jgi:hypothetical protein
MSKAEKSSISRTRYFPGIKKMAGNFIGGGKILHFTNM